MSDSFNQVVLVALGWLLGVLSQGMERRRQEALERRRVLTRLERILTTIVIEMAVTRELSSHRELPALPMLPEDFDRVVDQLGDWEARRGESTIHFRLLTLKRLVELAREGYATLDGKDDVPEPLLSIYERELEEVKRMTRGLISSVHGARLGPIGRIGKRLRRHSSEDLETRIAQEEQAQSKTPNPAATTFGVKAGTRESGSPKDTARRNTHS